MNKYDNPNYMHDCASCKFVCNLALNNKGREADCYICGKTLIVRYSDEINDYSSADINEFLYFVLSTHNSNLAKFLQLLMSAGYVNISFNLQQNK